MIRTFDNPKKSRYIKWVAVVMIAFLLAFSMIYDDTPKVEEKTLPLEFKVIK